jgi:hypothetical protein
MWERYTKFIASSPCTITNVRRTLMIF